MESNYPNLELKPPLFYNWDIGIRFQLGVELSEASTNDDPAYIQGVYNRAITLFECLHSHTDNMFVVVDVNDYGDGKPLKPKLRNFSPYVKEKSVLYKVRHQSILQDHDEDERFKTHRFTLMCKTPDFKHKQMLKAICNQDMGIKPKIEHRVYFINLNKKTIFHVYDDRGCDVLAASPETIGELYKRYYDWILGYDRERIDKVFK
ncbi:DUF3885 domain-containing protein [Alkalihalobacillus sp. CinArs1]|uniref:DUF3885 domain-containing protein n=1 Tax=Alkalihalobacillus sp. CinArs1 TaxID=2995314 RepID=UPI0022DE54EC|nr:DUF3885 domain-containing protein [Alkalihalobacillus sp. CinArs1]